MLGQYAVGNSYKLYNTLTPDDTKAISAAVDAIAEPLSQVSAKIATN